MVPEQSYICGLEGDLAAHKSASGGSDARRSLLQDSGFLERAKSAVSTNFVWLRSMKQSNLEIISASQ
jgi:hypothetical protein